MKEKSKHKMNYKMFVWQHKLATQFANSAYNYKIC